MAFLSNKTTLLMLSLVLLLGPSASSSAFAAGRPYVHPDFTYAYDLKQHFSIPEQVNINTASFNELKTLPGVDESVALKVIRHRKAQPFESMRELYQLPMLEKRHIRILIQKLDGKISFH